MCKNAKTFGSCWRLQLHPVTGLIFRHMKRIFSLDIVQSSEIPQTNAGKCPSKLKYNPFGIFKLKKASTHSLSDVHSGILHYH